jgi:hypothetical protein
VFLTCRYNVIFIAAARNNLNVSELLRDLEMNEYFTYDNLQNHFTRL